MTQSATRARRITRHWPWISGLVLIAVVLVGGALLTARGSNLEIDDEWMAEILENRSPFWDVPSLVLNSLGGGWAARLVVPVLVIATLCVVRRFRAAAYFAITVLLSAGAVQLLKAVFGRARPDEMLVTSDVGSFPSGHVANAATLAVALGLIFSHAWVWWVGAVYTVAMMLSRTYLGVHWLTDTVGGLLLGAGVAVIVWAPFAERLQRESQRRRAPLWRGHAARR